MIRNLLLLTLICTATLAHGQYLETFSVASKGYKINCADDFAGLNWLLTAWSGPTCAPTDNRDAGDYFNTTAAGVLESQDLDQEVCWESPLINTTAAPIVSVKVDLTWATFDSDVITNTCGTDYIKVMYSVNGGAYTMVPNVVGGSACATVGYVFQDPGQQYTSGISINQGGITGGSNLKIRVCVKSNVTAEVVTIDNVEVPQAGVFVGCTAPTLSTTVTQVGCSNPNSGSIDLGVSGGTAPYIYAWTGGTTTQDLLNKPAGTYTVTVTDAATCTATISATITTAPTLSLTTTVLDASCSGNTDGEIDLGVTGGVPGYTYNWGGGITTQDRLNIGVGTYTVTVTDASGCSATKSATVNVQPSGAYSEQFNIPNKGYLTNYIDDFSAVNWTLSGWAPSPPATFGRDPEDKLSTTGGVLQAIDLDQEVCWESPLIDLNGGTQFSVGLTWAKFDNQTDEYINVKYSIDGGAYITLPNVIGGGTGTIQYASGVEQTGATTITQTGLSGGTIQIMVCMSMNADDEIVTLDNVNIPGSNQFCPAPEPTLTPTNVTCNGAANGMISTSVVNGTAPYTYLWSNMAATQNLSNLAPGTYTVTVTDANMSTGTASTTITEPTAIVLTNTQVNVLCNGAATGSIDLMVSGGTPGYLYSWTGGATTQDRSGLAAGTYTVTVTDIKNCTKTLSVTISQTSAIVLTNTQVNVLCNGAATASVDLMVSGGNPGYIYSWVGGVTTQDRSGLVAGTYTVTVTDANSCTKTLSVTITQPTPIVLTETHVDVLCNGNSTGSIDLGVSGGVPTYTYDWGGGVTTQDRSGLAAGTYTVTVTDNNSCTKTLSVTIAQPAVALTLNTSQVNVLCKGNASGSIDLMVSGGTSGYTYSWTGGATTQDRSNLVAGTYTVTVTDANTCTQTTSVTITEPALGIDLTETHVNVLCNGAATGSIDLMVSGGNPTYTYNWGGGVSTQDRSGLVAGTYTVTVTDANTCTQTLSVTITQPTAIVLTETHVDVLCNGNSTGSIDLGVSGGIPTYTYDWGGGVATQDRSNLAAGTYTVTVTDNNSCTKTLSVTIAQPAVALTLNTSQVNVLCKGNASGSIDLMVSGGTPTYAYDWGGGVTTQDRSNLVAGTYTVTVTDANGCTKTTSVTITEPALGIDLTETHVNVLCNGAATGSIDLMVSGGNPTYTYNWGGGVSTQDRSGLVAGTYTVTVIDANSCTQTLSVTITQPTAIILTETHVDVLCNGNSTGSIDLGVSGGIPTYTYNWGGGVTTQDRSNLAAGTYTVTVTDNNSCTKTLSVNIAQPAVALTLNTSQVNVLCKGNASGSIDLMVSGGTPTYTYNWGGGVTTQDRSNLVAGAYTVTVTDANGCTKTTSVTITEPALGIDLTETHVNVLCNGNATGSIDLIVSGGTPTYTYNWGGGISTQDRSNLVAGTYTVTVTDQNNCTQTLSVTITQPTNIVVTEGHVNVLCNGSATGSIDIEVSGGVPTYTYNWGGGVLTQDRSNLVAGTYTVTVTDANSCTKTLSVTITQPTAIVLTETHVNVLCNGNATGSIDLSVSGGVPGYTYNWGGGVLTQDRSGLAAGTYTVTVTDANACTNTLSVTITQPSGLLLTETHVNVLCNGSATGSIDLTVSGGTGGYIYNWGGGVSTQDRSGLTAGTYTVTVTDGNSCSQTLSVIITQPTTIVVTETHVDVACNGNATGSINISVSGGVPGYTYNWGGGVLTEDRSNLVAGTYTVTVTDNNSCTKTLSVTIAQPTAIVLTETHVNVLCNGNVTGSIDLSVAGGTPGYTYNWTGGVLTQDRSGLAAGTYTVTVTDANGCTKTLSTTITEPAALSLSATTVTPTNCFVTNGSIDLTVSGGASGYTYDWSNDGPDPVDNDTQDLGSLGEGTYTVTVTDGNGCSATLSKVLDYIDIVPPTLVCPSNQTVTADASCSSAIGAYGPVTLTDNCTLNLTYSQSPVSSTVINGSTPSRLVTLSTTDEAGNPQTCTFTVSLVDQVLPNITCPANAIIPANASCSGVVGSWTPASVSDNCDANPVVVQLTPANTPLSGHNATGIVVLRATDGSGNSQSCSFVVTLKDQTVPALTCPANQILVANASCSSVIGAYSPISLSDNCTASPAVVQSPASSTILTGHNASSAITLTATDNAGNSSACSFTVTLKDQTAPTVVCKPFTANLNAAGAASITTANVFQSGSDNCGVVNQVSVVPSSFNCGNIGANNVTLTVNDGNGNTNTCQAVVTVVDATAPTVVCKPFTANLNAAGTVTVTPANVYQSGADNCGTVNLQSVSPSTFGCANVGANNVTLVVNDGHGNTGSCVAVVTVVDPIFPTMLCRNVTLNLDATGNATLTVAQVNNGSFDNCSIIGLSLSQTAFSCSNIGTTTVTLSGRDPSFNQSQCTATVTVVDPIVPIAKCKNATVNLGANGTVVVDPNQVNNGSSDNCAFTLTVTPGTFTCSNVGVNSVVLRATDAGGNTATCLAQVTVRDVAGPTVLCKNATVYLNGQGQGTLLISQVDNGSFDNCSIAALSISQDYFNCSELTGGPWPVTLTMRDIYNNASSCVAYVTVKDTIKPTAICEDVTVYLGANGKAVVYGANLGADSYDNCSIWSYSPTAKVYTAANIGPNNLTITVKDGSNNSATCVSVVTVLAPSPGNGSGFQVDNADKFEVGNQELLVYPNPTTGNVSMAFQLPAEQAFTCRVFDLSGRLIFSHEDLGIEGENVMPLHLFGIAPGVYLIDFQTADWKIQKRLVVQE